MINKNIQYIIDNMPVDYSIKIKLFTYILSKNDLLSDKKNFKLSHPNPNLGSDKKNSELSYIFNILEMISTEISLSTASIFITQVSNSLGDSLKSVLRNHLRLK